MRGRTCSNCGFDISRDEDDCPICTYSSFVVENGRVTPLNANPKKSSEFSLDRYAKPPVFKLKRINIDNIVIKRPMLIKESINNNFSPNDKIRIEFPSLKLLEVKTDLSTWKTRLLNYNEFLKDVYQSEVRISDILLKSNLQQNIIEVVKKDVNLLSLFLDSMTVALVSMMQVEFPSLHKRILIDWYGLNGKPPSTFKEISKLLNLPENDVVKLHDLLISYLRLPKSTKLFEWIVSQIGFKIILYKNAKS